QEREPVPIGPPNGISAAANSPSTSAAINQSKSSEVVLNAWKDYQNPRYRYRLSYPASAQIGNDFTQTSSLDLAYISIDPKAEPIHVCATDNLRACTSE